MSESNFSSNNNINSNNFTNNSNKNEIDIYSEQIDYNKNNKNILENNFNIDELSEKEILTQLSLEREKWIDKTSSNASSFNSNIKFNTKEIKHKQLENLANQNLIRANREYKNLFKKEKKNNDNNNNKNKTKSSSKELNKINKRGSNKSITRYNIYNNNNNNANNSNNINKNIDSSSSESYSFLSKNQKYPF